MTNWVLDPMHTQVEFSVKHLGMMTVRGLFTEVSAGGNIDPDNPENSSVEAVVQMASIRTHNENRDKERYSKPQVSEKKNKARAASYASR